MRLRPRKPWHPRGKPISNTRQIPIVSEEECLAIAHAMGIAQVYPNWLGANLVTKNFPNLSAMAPATRLVFLRDHTFITEENVPYRHPGKVTTPEYGHPEFASEFDKAALGRRAVLALIERQGFIKTDDRIKVILPRARPTP